MKTSEAGIAFIKRNEGFVGVLGNDVGHPVIGHGHDLTLDEISSGAYAHGISQGEADSLLRKDLASRYEPAVNALIPAQCDQGQFDSLVDFCYNLGAGALKTMMAHGWFNIPEQMLRWDKIGAVENAGLKARREAEVAMWSA